MKLNVDYADAKKRILAAKDLFIGTTTTREKIGSLHDLLHGINGDLDMALSRCEKEFAKIEAIQGGNVVEIAAEHMTEETEEEKRRKKALLLFLKEWKQLQSEMARVSAALNSNNGQQQDGSNWVKVFSSVAGPLGIITLLAVGIVLAAEVSAVQVHIANNGCDSITLPESIPNLPGLALPKEPITSTAPGTATVPPLPVTIDNTVGRTMKVSTLGFSASYEVPSGVTSVTLDGTELLGAKTEVNLLNSKQHAFAVTCTRLVQSVGQPAKTPVPAPTETKAPAGGSPSTGTP